MLIEYHKRLILPILQRSDIASDEYVHYINRRRPYINIQHMQNLPNKKTEIGV